MVKLSDCDFKKLLPMFMRNDPFNMALAEIINIFVEEIYGKYNQNSAWDMIDTLDESELDALADDLNILWYQYDASISRKREIIRLARGVWNKMGTPWALEQVLSVYFNDSELREWYEYGGDPGHFKVVATNQAIIDEQAEKFLKILNRIKKCSQHLDEIEIGDYSTLDLNYILVGQNVTKEYAITIE